MRKYLTLILAACWTIAQAQVTENIDSKINGATENVAPSFTQPYKDVGNIPTTFPNQPPLVPHSIRGLQVTKNANQCLGCHSPEFAPTTGAPRVPESHFMGRDGKRTTEASPRRYFCLQCHVQQTDVDPIIQNKFDSIRQTPGK